MDSPEKGCSGVMNLLLGKVRRIAVVILEPVIIGYDGDVGNTTPIAVLFLLIPYRSLHPRRACAVEGAWTRATRASRGICCMWSRLTRPGATRLSNIARNTPSLTHEMPLMLHPGRIFIMTFTMVPPENMLMLAFD